MSFNQGAVDMKLWKYRIVFLGYGLFGLYLLITGDIARFIASKLAWLTYLSAFFFSLFLFMVTDTDECGCESHRHKGKNDWRELLKAAMLIYPLLLFFIIKPSDISALNMPAIKTLNLRAGETADTKKLSLEVDEEGYANLNVYGIWLIAGNYPELAERYKFKTIGMVSDISAERITVQRILMTCCTADAQPVRMDVKTTGDNFKKGQWLGLSGKAVVADKKLIFIPDRIEPVSAPSNPYISLWESLPAIISN
jgi:uncharacterized repeat protein (TIGR03943 family)